MQKIKTVSGFCELLRETVMAEIEETVADGIGCISPDIIKRKMGCMNEADCNFEKRDCIWAIGTSNSNNDPLKIPEIP